MRLRNSLFCLGFMIIVFSTLYAYRSSNLHLSSLATSNEPLVTSENWKIVNKIPTIEFNGQDWYPQSNSIPYGLTQDNTRWCSELGYGFLHMMKAGFSLNLLVSTTWTEAGIGEPYEHPDPTNPVVLSTDLPLLPADHWSFQITSRILMWIQPTFNSYLECGFGGWIILDKPYTVMGEWQKTDHPRIIELMFAVRTDVLEDGNGEWSRLYWRAGTTNPDQGWLICQYAISRQEIGEWKTQALKPDVFHKLISSLNNTSFAEKNPALPRMHSIQNLGTLFGQIEIKDIDFTNAVFRFAYIDLEGGADFLSLGVVQAQYFVRSMYVLHKEEGS